MCCDDSVSPEISSTPPRELPDSQEKIREPAPHDREKRPTAPIDRIPQAAYHTPPSPIHADSDISTDEAKHKVPRKQASTLHDL